MTTQPGVLALGTTDHCYLELDATADADAFVRLLASVTSALPTSGGVTVVCGLRPSLWAQVSAAASDLPSGAQDWTEPVVGPDGFTMPATPHDAWVWIAGGDRGTVFDAAVAVIAELVAVAHVATEYTGWIYRHDRDLTGFIDGTENPTPLEAPDVVATGDGSTVVLYQVWTHDSASWEAQPVEVQERAIGRTKDDSTELDEDVMPEDSHVSRSVVERDGEELEIFRRNTAFGGPTEHGTLFVGFSHDQWRMAEMLRRMAGVGDGLRDRLTRYTTPVTGAYYVVPSVEALTAFATVSD